MNSIFSKSGAILLALGLPIISSSAPAQDSLPKEASKARQYAYGKSGEWLYQGLRKLQIAGARKPDEGKAPFDLPVDWKTQFETNGTAFPFLGQWFVDYAGNPGTALVSLAAFRVKFHADGPALFDHYLLSSQTSKHLRGSQKTEVHKHEFTLRERSLVFCLAWRQDQVQFVYYPGKIQLMGGARDHMGHWLSKSSWRVQRGLRSDYALIQDSHGLLSILNGTFDKVDNFARWNPKGTMKYGGFGFNFTRMMAPQPEMATYAQYEDGHIALGSWKNIPEKEKIHSFVQNRFMVIEKGALARDADPDSFCSYPDNIARAYLFTDKAGRIGYLWTLYTPANVLAPIALKMGVEDMMLLDIHAPLSCSISDPTGPLDYSSWEDYMNRSFDYVPNFFRLSRLQAALTWMSQALGSRIQTHYIQEAFKLGYEDYFAVFLKDSPEGERVRKPRPEGTVKVSVPNRALNFLQKNHPQTPVNPTKP